MEEDRYKTLYEDLSKRLSSARNLAKNMKDKRGFEEIAKLIDQITMGRAHVDSYGNIERN